MPLRRSLAALGLAALSACSGPRVEVRRRPDAAISHRVAAVYPYAFRWEEPAFRSHQKAMDLTLFLASQGRLLVFGPGEFHVFRHEEESPLVGTNLVAVLQARGLDPKAFLAFRGWAERRVARSTGQVEGARGPVRTRSTEEVTYVAHLQVVDAARSEVVVEVEGEVRPGDPAERPEYDPAPELTRMNRRLARVAWEELSKRLASPPLAKAPVEVQWLPAATLDYAPDGERSLRERLVLMDPLQADLERLSVYRYFSPEAPPKRIGLELKLPGGLYVEQVFGSFASFLREGDVITLVNGEIAVGPQVLQRALNLSAGKELQLKVARGAARLELTIPFDLQKPER